MEVGLLVIEMLKNVATCKFHVLAYPPGKTTTTEPPLPQRATTAWVGASSRKEVREVVKEMAACCQKKEATLMEKGHGKNSESQVSKCPPQQNVPLF